ncbi:molybdopterin dinucleotide binding domain-containing protein [Thiorhodovibrio frisius]|uniref:Anaerobic dehydrogenase, typically selenocysteine-containing n=1 Tax=Thiorhodovibrio frisius TaxID=631362 RepID=H8Z3R4_9GAMM|nr:molybdopterin dinucleotide binding domain-containing protein [Thiorhodovibrio frisius]EIC20053.1 anaerobic dehydrogenase, typically selenocysteine-containing [Thiorhodovibrio frisius]WPL20781.1 Sulfur reductase chain A [Thiorhodovibrio frisius]
MSRTVEATCPLCEACCGLLFTLEGDQVTRVRGDRDDPLSCGFMCTKGAALPELHADPDRLRRPLRRTATGWEELDWPAALDFAAAGLRAVKQAHGPDAVAVYRGNPNAHSLGLLLFGHGVIRALGTHNLYSATSMDQLPHMLVALRMYGHQLLMPVPDLDRTGFLLILGANPLASNGSTMTSPAVGQRLRAIQQRGGRVVVVDPRRTRTAELADQHLFIRPSRDALLLAALLQVIFAERLERLGRLGAFVNGLDAVRAAVAPFTPARVAERIGIAAEVITALAREFAAAQTAVVYGRIGTSVQAHGVLCQWLIQLLNLVTGNLDHPGGNLFSSPAVDPIGILRLSKQGTVGRWHSRVRGLPEICGELPVAVLAEEMQTPGAGQVRALLTVAGNPALSMPGGAALDRALAGLDFMVSVDFYRNETSRHADIILPPVSPLEREHYDLVFNFLAIRNVAKWSTPVLAPPAGALGDWEILSGLHRRLAENWRQRAMAAFLGRLGPRRLLALALHVEARGAGLLPFSKRLTLRRLEAAVHGVDLGPLVPRLPDRLCTKDQRIDAAPADFIKELARLDASGETPAAAGLDLQLIGRRSLRSNNSWMHNLPRLMAGADRCTLLMHPADAAARGLSQGALVRVRSAYGVVEVTLDITETMMPGVVSLPHGYGHDREGAELSVAAARPGVNVNRLIDPRAIDPLGTTSVLTGTAVAVSANLSTALYVNDA